VGVPLGVNTPSGVPGVAEEIAAAGWVWLRLT
jgi:hypothetical protein